MKIPFATLTILLTLGLLACIAQTPNNGQLNNGLVAFYTFTGSSLNDISSTQAKATFSGDDCSYRSDRNGKPKQALSVNKSDPNGVSCLMTPAPISFAGDFTVSMWVNINEATFANTVGDIMAQSMGDRYGFVLRMIYQNDEFFGGQDAIQVLNGGGYYCYKIDLVRETWFHIVVVNQGGVYTIYKDGVPVPVTTGSGLGDGQLPNNATQDVLRYGYNQYHYSGGIDEVRIWNRALTVEEVTTLYDSEKKH